jgi:hypothetical protein
VRRLLALLRLVPIGDHRRALERVAMWRAKYDEAWADHLARCGCHDAWDQCPCSEVGHKPLEAGRSIHECANRCCRWCG